MNPFERTYPCEVVDGPHAGKVVYVTENQTSVIIKPLKAKQVVDPSEAIKAKNSTDQNVTEDQSDGTKYRIVKNIEFSNWVYRAIMDNAK